MGKHTLPVILVSVFTMAIFAFAPLSRLILGYPSLTIKDLSGLRFDPLAAGTAIQGLFLPAGLLFLLAHTPLVRRVTLKEATALDIRSLFIIMAALQLLSLLLQTVNDFDLLLSFLVVIAGALLAGWRMGLGLGILTMFFRGIADFVQYYQPAELLAEIGPQIFIDPRTWVYLFFGNMAAIAPLWAGVLGGFAFEQLGRRRFQTLPALLLTVLLVMAGGLLIAIQLEQPNQQVSSLPAVALVSALAIGGLVMLVQNMRAEADRQRAAEAELASTRAELRALRAQINPHFLFNALNTIRYFARTDPPVARRLLGNLSEIFQRALRSGDMIPLRDELQYVAAYLALEQARFEARLQVEWQVPQEAALLDQLVPTLILQPIVENAVLHGVASKPEGGRVTIRAVRAANGLLLSVADNGPGIEPARLDSLLEPLPLGPAAKRPSIGLRNVNQRLLTVYGENHGLQIASSPNQGTTVTLQIPFA